MRTKIAATILLTCLVLSCSSCDSISTLKKALLADKMAWGGMQDDFIALHKAGKLTEDQWTQINLWDKRIVAIHNLAVDLGKTYELTKDKATYDKILAIVGESAAIIADARAVWNSLHGGK